MPTIALIDDRRELRTTLLRRINIELQGDWKIFGIAPLPELREYPSWIMQNEISVLIIDEKLHEQIEASTRHVNYDGHDLVDFIRQRIPTLPIFVVTSYQSDEDLQQRFKSVEDIIARQDFAAKAKGYITRMQRASQKFLETFEQELSELSVAAGKIAKGKATRDDLRKASAIQAKIGVAFATQTFSENDKLLKNLESKVKKLEQISSVIAKYIKSK